MGFIDKFKQQAPGLKDKATDLAREHGEKIDSGIDKAADLADKATKGKYAEQIDGPANKAKDAVDDLEDPKKDGPKQ